MMRAWMALLLLGGWTAQAQVDHSPRWTGGSRLTYGLEDLDATTILPGAYLYCRWGNKMDEQGYNAFGNVSLSYSDLTQGPFANVADQDALDLFMTRDTEVLERRLFPANTDWSRPGDVRFDVGWFQNTDYVLFRYLHFRNTLTNDASTGVTDRNLDASTRKLIVLFHGWNPDPVPVMYDGDYGELADNIASQIAGTEWRMMKYRWEADADTGAINLSSAINGTEAAEISHQHGWHLGALLNQVCPNLESIHVIAHSAGTWAARSTVRYLLARNASIRVQFTLLDPFMPNAIPLITSTLGEPVMSQLDAVEGHGRIYRLENYYASGADVALGTQEVFAWRPQDLNLRTDWSTVLPPAFHYDGHWGPREFYRDTIAAAYPGATLPTGLTVFNLATAGWRASMFLREPVVTAHPVSLVRTAGLSGALTASIRTREAGRFGGGVSGMGYQWYRDGVPVPGQTGTSLVFAAVSSRDAGTYRLLATNAAGVAWTENAEVTVMEPIACGGTNAASLLAESWPTGGAALEAGSTFLKSWTVVNTGSSTWRRACGQQLRQQSGHEFGSPPAVEMQGDLLVGPGASMTWSVPLTAPTATGAYQGVWRMAQDDGTPFGPPLMVDIEVTAGGSCPGLDAAVVAGLTGQPDGPVGLGTVLEVAATLSNTGSRVWSLACGHALERQPGSASVGPERLFPSATNPVAPGAVTSWRLPIEAPSQPGVYTGVWRMARAGVPFGDPVVVVMTVIDEGTDCGDDAYEQNDRPAIAFDPGRAHHRWLSEIAGPGVQGDEDWYRIVVTNNVDTLSVTCVFVHAEGDIDLRLWRDATNLIASSLGYTNTETITHPVSNGTYYLQVFDYFTNGSCNAYDLYWAITRTNPLTCVEDAYEDNNTPERAFDLTGFEGMWLSSLNGTATQSDDDWYRIEVTPGYRALTVIAEFAHTNGDIDLAVYRDPAAPPLAVSDGTVDDERIDLVVPTSGVYYVKVHYGNQCNPYDLWWNDDLTGSLDLHLVGDYLSVPVAVAAQPGRLAGSGLEESIRFTPAGSGGAGGTALLADLLPVYHSVVGVASNRLIANGTNWFMGPLVTDLSTSTQRCARIEGQPVSNLWFRREVRFAPAEQHLTVWDRLENVGGDELPAVVTLESINPDLDLPFSGSYRTANDIDDGVPFVVAVATNSGLSIALASSSPTARFDAYGFENTDPYVLKDFPIDNDGAWLDHTISLVHDYGDLAPGAVREVVWYWIFGQSRDEIFLRTILLRANEDGDRDGLPDAWEYARFPDLLGAGPEEDADGDGLDNEGEWRAGTEPLSADSVFRAVAGAPPGAAADGVVIRWSSATNRSYDIYRATHLPDGFTLWTSGVAAVPPVNAVTDRAPPSVGAAYQIRLAP